MAASHIGLLCGRRHIAAQALYEPNTSKSLDQRTQLVNHGSRVFIANYSDPPQLNFGCVVPFLTSPPTVIWFQAAQADIHYMCYRGHVYTHSI